MTERAPLFRFGPNDRLQIGAIAYRAANWNELGHVFRRDDEYGSAEEFSHAVVNQLLKTGSLVIDRNFYSEAKALARLDHGSIRLSDLSFDDQRKCIWRKDYCDRFIRMQHLDRKVSKSDASMKKAIAQISVEVTALEFRRQAKSGRAGTEVKVLLPPSPSRLRTWLKRYIEGGYDPISLWGRQSRSGNRTLRFDSASRIFAKGHACRYADNRRPSKAMVYTEYKEALEQVNAERVAQGKPLLHQFSSRTFEKMIDRLDPFQVCVAREGIEAAKKKFAIINDGLLVTRPLERVEMDEWNVSLQTLLVDAGVWGLFTPNQQEKLKAVRVWLTAAIDCATRCILALRLSVNAPCADSAISALEMIVSDKTHIAGAAGATTPWNQGGTCESLGMDAGAAFVAIETRIVGAQCGIEMFYPPAGVAQMRPHIESLFANFQDHFARYFAGQTFENVVAKGDYDSVANASLYVDELNKTLVRYVVDAYHNTPHAGLSGETPYNAWLRLTAKYPVLPPPDAEKRRHIFGLLCHRRIGARGIRILGLHYQSPALQMLRRAVGQQKVMVRVDRHDLGEISVHMGDGWLSIPFARQGMDLKGVSYWEWLAASRHLAHRNADMSKLSAPTVMAALRSVRETADMAIVRAELGTPILTQEELDRADRELFRVFDFVDGGTPSPEDLLGDDEQVDDEPPPPANQPLQDLRRFRDDMGGNGDWLSED